MKSIFQKKNFFFPILSISLSLALVTSISYASTTISTDINTEGTLTVTGISNLKDKIYNSFGALMLDQAGQTNTNIVLNPTTGNVGVGTSTPNNKLDLNGNFYASGTSFFGGAITATSSLTLSNLGTNMILTSNGSGTLLASSTPTAAAYFATSTTATSTFAGDINLGKQNLSQTSTNPTLYINGWNASYVGIGGGVLQGKLYSVDWGGGNNLTLEAMATSGPTNNIRLQVSSAGNSHIGFNLGGTGMSAVVVRRDTVSGSPFLGIRSAALETGSDITQEARLDMNQLDGLRLYTQEANYGTTTLLSATTTIPNGKLAIRTSNPQAPLAIGVIGVSGEGLAISMGHNSLATYQNKIYAGISSTIAANNYLRFEIPYNGGSLEVLRMNGAGNVGIGTTTPTANLQVTTSTANATTTLELGKTGQNKGSCLKMYDETGTVKYVTIRAGSFAISDISCQ